MDAWDSAAIFRLCRRCREWLPLSKFVGVGKLCQPCVRTFKPAGFIAKSRAIVITESGHELLRQIRAESVA